MIQIVATNGLRSETKTFKKEVSLERAQEVMEQMYEDDYLGLSYYLYVDGEEYLALEN